MAGQDQARDLAYTGPRGPVVPDALPVEPGKGFVAALVPHGSLAKVHGAETRAADQDGAVRAHLHVVHPENSVLLARGKHI